MLEGNKILRKIWLTGSLVTAAFPVTPLCQLLFDPTATIPRGSQTPRSFLTYSKGNSSEYSLCTKYRLYLVNNEYSEELTGLPFVVFSSLSCIHTPQSEKEKNLLLSDDFHRTFFGANLRIHIIQLCIHLHFKHDCCVLWKDEGSGMFDDKKSEPEQCLVVSMLPVPEHE